MRRFRGRKGDEIGPKAFFAADERGPNHLATNARELTRIEKTAATKENQPQRAQTSRGHDQKPKATTLRYARGQASARRTRRRSKPIHHKTNINHSAAEPRPNPFCRWFR